MSTTTTTLEVWVKVRGQKQAVMLECGANINIDKFKNVLKARLPKFSDVDGCHIIFRNADNDDDDTRIGAGVKISQLGDLGTTYENPIFVDPPPNQRSEMIFTLFLLCFILSFPLIV